MKLAWVKVDLLPRHNRAAVVIVTLWGILMLALEAIGRTYHVNTSICLLKRFTGMPCPACGGTRSFVRLLHGDLPGAAAFNPLAVIVLFVVAAVLAIRLTARRQVQVQLGSFERVAAVTVMTALIILNWAYVIHCHR